MSEDHFPSLSTDKSQTLDTSGDHKNNQDEGTAASACIIEDGVAFTLPAGISRHFCLSTCTHLPCYFFLLSLEYQATFFLLLSLLDRPGFARSTIPSKSRKKTLSRSAMNRMPKARPNHFFAVQISSPQVNDTSTSIYLPSFDCVLGLCLVLIF